MGISTNLMGKQILEGILNESSFNLKSTNIKIASIKSFDNACKDNDLSPYYCIVQILENDIDILLFSLQKARERITDSGLNVRIQEK